MVRRGNAAYAAGLALLMAGDPDAAEWLRRAAARWRESWDAGEGRESWGRPIGALKASLLAGDDAAVEELARWALELGCATAESPIGRYAARWPCSRSAAGARHGMSRSRCASATTSRTTSATQLAFIAAHDVIGYIEAVESVVESFETREEFLEDVRVADTALVAAGARPPARPRGRPARLAVPPVSVPLSHVAPSGLSCVTLPQGLWTSRHRFVRVSDTRRGRPAETAPRHGSPAPPSHSRHSARDGLMRVSDTRRGRTGHGRRRADRAVELSPSRPRRSPDGTQP